MIEITEHIALKESEIEFDFMRAGGPGGQHVNRSATAVQLRFDVRSSTSLPEDVRRRLRRLAGRRMTQDGVLIISARNYRSQERNRQDALDRLVELIQKAAQKPRVRRKSRRPAAADRLRLEHKRRRAEKKRLRQSPGREDI